MAVDTSAWEKVQGGKPRGRRVWLLGYDSPEHRVRVEFEGQWTEATRYAETRVRELVGRRKLAAPLVLEG